MSECLADSRERMADFGTIARILAGFTLLSVFQIWNGPGTKVEVIFIPIDTVICRNKTPF